MGRIPHALARRLDRLAAGAHRFHCFAHHPLCQAYSAETLQLGRRTRLCRGCTAAALGATLGVSLALALPVPPPPALLAGAALLGPALLMGVNPRGGGQAPALRPPAPPALPTRRSKILTRAAPACAAVAFVVLGMRAASWAGATTAVFTVACTFLAVQAYRRRGPDRRPCAVCPERALRIPCSGFAPIARREAAFARAAGRLLRAVPPSSPPR